MDEVTDGSDVGRGRRRQLCRKWREAGQDLAHHDLVLVMVLLAREQGLHLGLADGVAGPGAQRAGQCLRGE
jgi:hypothetical protein